MTRFRQDSMPSALSQLFIDYRSDRAVRRSGILRRVHPYHNYGALYNALFEPIRESATRVLELGVAEGAGIQALRDFFDRAEIYGVDRKLPSMTNTERLHLIEGEAFDNRSIVDGLPDGFDVIIEDTSHRNEHQIAALRLFWHKLRVGGLFIVEDLFVQPWSDCPPSQNAQMPAYDGYYFSPIVHEFLPKHPQDLSFLNRKGLPRDVSDLLDQNEYFFAITSIAKDGGLHMVLVIKKLDRSAA